MSLKLFSSQAYKCDFFLRQTWIDERLFYEDLLSQDEIYVPIKFMDEFWTPDTFVVNNQEIKVHEATKPNRSLYIYSNGTVFMTIRWGRAQVHSVSSYPR